MDAIDERVDALERQRFKLSTQNKKLRARNQQLTKIINGLLWHWEVFDDLGSRCIHCGARVQIGSEVKHAHDCAYRAALEAER
jgi:hypothetical protein